MVSLKHLLFHVGNVPIFYLCYVPKFEVGGLYTIYNYAPMFFAKDVSDWIKDNFH